MTNKNWPAWTNVRRRFVFTLVSIATVSSHAIARTGDACEEVFEVAKIDVPFAFSTDFKWFLRNQKNSRFALAPLVAKQAADFFFPTEDGLMAAIAKAETRSIENQKAERKGEAPPHDHYVDPNAVLSDFTGKLRIQLLDPRVATELSNETLVLLLFRVLTIQSKVVDSSARLLNHFSRVQVSVTDVEQLMEVKVLLYRALIARAGSTQTMTRWLIDVINTELPVSTHVELYDNHHERHSLIVLHLTDVRTSFGMPR